MFLNDLIRLCPTTLAEFNEPLTPNPSIRTGFASRSRPLPKQTLLRLGESGLRGGVFPASSQLSPLAGCGTTTSFINGSGDTQTVTNFLIDTPNSSVTQSENKEAALTGTFLT